MVFSSVIRWWHSLTPRILGEKPQSLVNPSKVAFLTIERSKDVDDAY